jgi:hypothetical protein
MAEAGIGRDPDVGPGGLEPGGQSEAVARLDPAVVEAVKEQDGRSARRRVADRLSLGGARPSAERRDRGGIVERQEIVGAGETGEASNRAPVRAQQRGVERQHGGVVGAGGMADEDDALAVAAISAGMAARPMDRRGAIAQEIGIAHFRHQPVIRNEDDEALSRQSAGGEGIALAAAAVPRAAIEEDDHRPRPVGGSARRVDVELEPRAQAIGDAFGQPGRRPVLGHEQVEASERVDHQRQDSQDKPRHQAPPGPLHEAEPSIAGSVRSEI